MPPPTEIDALYEALETAAPEFEATAREAEIQRSAPDRLAAALRAAKVPLVKAPREVGGFEMAPAQQVDYFARLAYLNPTAGWIAFNQAGSLSLIASKLAEAGLEKLFARGAPLVAAVSNPTGRSARDGNGFRASGRWQYASGVACSDYAVLMTICEDPPAPLGVIVPVSELTFHDDWHVAALQGSGSIDVSLDDAFVPTEMTFDPFGPQQRGGPMFALGYKVFVAGENFGFSLGVAQRFLHEISEQLRHKRRVIDPGTVGARSAFQVEVARTDFVLRSARALMLEELETAMEFVAREGLQPEENRLRVEGALSWATESVVQACVRLFPFAGASALHLDNPLQRALRDLIGSGQHYVASNQQIEDWGRWLAGPEETSP